jgi:ammonium transporter
MKLEFILIIFFINFVYGNNDDNSGDSDDSTWILTSSIVIFSMQSGFALLESGIVSKKNTINIMMKNLADVIFGGIIYYFIGYNLIFGSDDNGFISIGNFMNESEIDRNSGWYYSKYFFHLSFCTTATTIVSGALCERSKFSAYIIFSLFNTILYCIPAFWIFNENGWLKQLGVVDFAGAGPVHLLGGASALVGAFMLKPRIEKTQSSSLTNIMFGCFLLWWGWLSFNCGSTFGITENKWIYASISASNTINASIGGGLLGHLYSYIYYKKFDVIIIVNSILSSLVAITSCCANVDSYASIIIGFISAYLSIISNNKIKKFVDDPVGVFSTHCIGGVVGLISAGLFTKHNLNHRDKIGLFYSGKFDLLLIQLLEIVSIISWSLIMSFIVFYCIDKTIGLRMTEQDEILGADIKYHIIDIEENIVENDNRIHDENIIQIERNIDIN